MTIETWKEEFYQVHTSYVTKDKALAHSLKKWEGLRRESRARHEVTIDQYGRLNDQLGQHFHIDGSSCALCKLHRNCAGCPLVEERGADCDMKIMGTSPWHEWSEKQNPEPMIKLIKGAMENEHD